MESKGSNETKLMNAKMMCVGVVALAGCFALVVAPDEEREKPSGALPTVVIDPGHGGRDDGAKSGNVREKTLTLQLAQRLEDMLKARGFPVVTTRTTDVYIPLPKRSVIANRIVGPAVFVSLHFNQGGGKNTAGIETLYADDKAPLENWMWIGEFRESADVSASDERDLAADVQKALIFDTGARDRGILARHIYVTRHTHLPAILVEGGFITSPVVRDSDSYAEREARAIADGIQVWWRGQTP